MMAYVTLEDDSASMELLAFSSCLNQFGGYLKENTPIIAQGRISVRDEKEPQLVLNSARLLSEVEASVPLQSVAPRIRQSQKLYLRLPGETGTQYQKTKAVLNMFPGTSQVVLFFQDTQVRRGTSCLLSAELIEEMVEILGKENVVLK